jgi:signal transduction histidine kinase
VSADRVKDTTNFPFRLDMKFESKDERTFVASILMTPFFSEKHRQTGWLFMVRDNSSEAKAQFLINDALSSYQKLLNSVKSCISVVRHSPSGSILGIRNTPYTEQLGYTINGHQAISDAFTIPFDATGRREEVVWVPSLERWFNATEIRMTLSEGNLATMQAALDVTVAKAASDSLERQAQKMEASSRFISLGEMASTVTHEINQPLTAISTYSNTALEVFSANPNAFTPEKALEVFTKIRDQSNRIAKIIHNIRTFSQKKAATTSIVHIETIVNDSMEFARLIEKRSNVKVICETEAGLPDVECDALQIVQVVINLIRNAADAIAEKNCPDRRVFFRVRAVEDGTYVRFEIADHGPGISDAFKKTLFLPFYTTKKDGLGLGLSICRSIIEAHSSRLRLEDNEGGGAMFFFELKAAK